MRLDLKIQDKYLKEMKHVSKSVNQQGEFDFTENELFRNFYKDISHIFESLSYYDSVYRGVSWILAT